MATSGSVDFSLTRDNIIKMALQKLGIVGEGGTPSSDQYTEGALQLNAIVKSWNATLGMPLWALDTVYLLPVTDTNEILVGATGNHATETYYTTTLASASTANDTTLELTSDTGTADNAYVGIELDDGTMHWTQEDGAASASVITVDTGIASAAAAGNRVYIYSTKAPRPLRIMKAFARDIVNSVDIPVDIITSHEWMEYSNKSSESTYPLKITYEPRIDNGLVRIWPRWNDDLNWIIVGQYHRPIEDFDATGDTPDFPQEYYLPLVYELACTMAPNYDKPIEDRKLLRAEADRWLDRVAQNDYEEGSIYFQPKRDYW